MKATAASDVAGRVLRTLLNITKGVVGKIYDDDWMPVDEYGIRADMWIDMNSPVGRNNPGQFYETGINRIGEFVRRETEKVYEVKGVDDAFSTVMDWYNDVNPNYAKLITENTRTVKDRKRVVLDVIEQGPRIWIPPFLDKLTPSDDEFWNALINVKNWQTKWNVHSTPITYKSLQSDGTGKEFTTVEKFAIGSKYILHLHKIPEIFATGPSSVSHLGIPTKSNYENRNFPVITNPIRYGEDENRVMAMDSDVREVVRLQNLLSNSPTGATLTVKSILLADHPTRIMRIPISNGELARTSVVTQLFHSTTAALGLETKSTRNDEHTDRLNGILESSNELAESIYNTDIVNYDLQPSGSLDGEDGPARKSSRRSKAKKVVEEDMEVEELAEIEEDLSDGEEA